MAWVLVTLLNVVTNGVNVKDRAAGCGHRSSPIGLGRAKLGHDSVPKLRVNGWTSLRHRGTFAPDVGAVAVAALVNVNPTLVRCTVIFATFEADHPQTFSTSAAAAIRIRLRPAARD